MAGSLSFLALDMGAESGRVMLGKFDGSTIALSEAHRFESGPVLLPDGLHTDVLHIWAELKRGMAKAVKSAGGTIAGIGVDTWGVDFALIDRGGALAANPYQYRDRLTEGILPKAFRRVQKKEIFERTGLQFMPINTLYQLYALKLRKSPVLDIADRLLMISDLFNFWLSGEKKNEFSIATTSQCYDPRAKGWAKGMLKKFGIPLKLFGPIIAPGTVIGPLLPRVAEEIGVKGAASVITPGGHDTTLAVAAVPAAAKDFAYISCGTWSCMGAEIPEPCITGQGLAADFTNEGGVCGTFRFLKNLTGLWIMQECRRAWERQGLNFSYTQLTKMAAGAEAASLRSFIDTNDPDFSAPGEMPEKIRRYCLRTGQPVPQSEGAVIRCALESLALTYKRTLLRLESILGRRLDPVHMVGGGTQNRLLCRFAANAMDRVVVAGPVEATAVGNIMMQAMALGRIRTLQQGRAIVAKSFEVVKYQPRNTEAWNEAYGKYLKIASK
jgi:rhamnulokinase